MPSQIELRYRKIVPHYRKLVRAYDKYDGWVAAGDKKIATVEVNGKYMFVGWDDIKFLGGYKHDPEDGWPRGT